MKINVPLTHFLKIVRLVFKAKVTLKHFFVALQEILFFLTKIFPTPKKQSKKVSFSDGL